MEVSAHHRQDVGNRGRLPPRIQSALRTLPLRVEPVPGEQMDSWLEALAARSGAMWVDILTAVGLNPRENAMKTCRQSATAAQLAPLSFTTGVDVTVLQAMTPASWLSSHGGPGGQPPFALPGSRFCPRCLADNGGRWPVWWRLRWAFACPLHDCLLVDVCPQCSRRQRIVPLPEGLIPTPGLCMRCALDAPGGRTPRRCGARLADSALTCSLDEVALQVQREILDVLARGSTSSGIYVSSPVTSAQLFADMTVIGEQLLRHSDRLVLQTHLPSAVWTAYASQAGASAYLPSAPLPWALSYDTTTAATVAAAACLTLPALDKTKAEAVQHLQDVIQTKSQRVAPALKALCLRGHYITSAARSALLPSLVPTLGAVEQLRHSGKTIRPLEPTNSGRTRGRCVPALAWPRWGAQFSCTGLGFSRLRSALGVALLLVDSPITVTQACTELGSVTTPRDVTRVLQMLHARAHWSRTASALASLAEQLDDQRCPIDYARRRNLSYRELLPDSQWHSMCRECGTAVGRAVKVQLYRCWLYERLTGSPARLSPHAIAKPKFWSALAEIPRVLTPELATALEATGREFLDGHGLSHEPLRWEPAANCAESAAGWHDVDVAVLHHQIREERLSLRAAAHYVGSDIDSIRAILSDQPAPRADLPLGGRGVGRATRHAAHCLPRDVFVDLYTKQNLSLATIATTIGVSRFTVTQLAHRYEIPLRPSHRPTNPPHTGP